ncbi:hypothetical protein LOK49_LG06G00597 [Camellia lanceoleosa]|uniref:Uncharacterized protein n=1 Tax=Camellia lanceoleosa TaxID=1840588 RepID=A0ACC0HCQ0_9ERIC|nr:hypothetical protein LOK49_LG06G00597 [Camellia lanceoleosa]
MSMEKFDLALGHPQGNGNYPILSKHRSYEAKKNALHRRLSGRPKSFLHSLKMMLFIGVLTCEHLSPGLDRSVAASSLLDSPISRRLSGIDSDQVMCTEYLEERKELIQAFAQGLEIL